MYCGNCGELLGLSQVACKSCLILLEDPALRTLDAERMLGTRLGQLSAQNATSEPLDSWKIKRLERIRERGHYGFHFVHLIQHVYSNAGFISPMSVSLYVGAFNIQEELGLLESDESENCLAILATGNWLMIFEIGPDYGQTFFQVPYKVAKSIGATVMYEMGQVEPEFTTVEDLTDLLSIYELWDTESEEEPDSKKARKAWVKNLYAQSTLEFKREDETLGILNLDAQVFNQDEPIRFEKAENSLETRLVGNGWMVTVLCESADQAHMMSYAEGVAENLGCEINVVR